MEFDDKMQQRIAALTASVVDVLAPELAGSDPMPWEATVLAAALAINAIGQMAEQIHQLDTFELKMKLLGAVMQGLTAPVKAVMCKSKEEFDARCAAQEAKPEGSVH